MLVAIGQFKTHTRSCFAAIIGAFLISACAPPPRVEVVERSVITVQAETEKIGGSLIRIVQPGDTLHSIAFGLGLNVNELAAWNQMQDTNRLLAGKQIRLTKPPNFEASQSALSKKVPVESIKSKPQIAKNTTNKPAPSSTAHKAVGYAQKKSLDRTAVPAGKPLWSWPTKGKIIGQFALAQGRQGIDILGRAGQPVLAASAGEVVYVGNGLKGYGNLIIIKHNERFLSAYAHNQKIFVKEGQLLAAKHSIGSIGKNRKGQTALHFQIRRDGKPLNPLAYLPRG